MNKKLIVCIAGASGFVGQELIKLLLKHPYVEIRHLFVNDLEGKDTDLIMKHKLPTFEKTDIKSIEVAQMVCAIAGSVFAKTTGAQIPIDGGNERVI